jgi:maleate cis-trans isomerase
VRYQPHRLRSVGGTRDELLAMTDKMEEAAELVSHAGADLIAFHCTAVCNVRSARPSFQFAGTLRIGIRLTNPIAVAQRV